MTPKEKNIETQEILIPPAGGQNKPHEISFPIVGIGASAGGLAAFEAFFSGMPDDDVETGIAFVLVQHLSPDYKSILPDIISRYTRMKVFEVNNGMVVRPDCVYVIPPDCTMTFLNGVLELIKPAALRHQRLPIDLFFRSLAVNQQERAIGIVLSGTGSDGTLGVRAIKGEGGMVMAQKPESTEYDGMPRSAIATGLVDYELLPVEMPTRIIAYARQSFGIPNLHVADFAPEVENVLNKIFILLHAHTGHDFSQYKTTTIRRRIERRMALQQITAIDRYIEYLQQTPAEVEALFRDMLIGVTNFFRDPKAFEELEKRIMPGFFTGKNSDSVIRIWSSGCSTGEEAYSIAILLAEYQISIKRNFKVQIFATDIDSNAIATARAGLYPSSIAADVSPERLTRFFTEESSGNAWRINKNIRDMLIFSEQNIIRDPIFSKLDLISCRNLMIYFDQKLQKQIFPRFHYALNPGGVLFLGTSETIGEFIDLFYTIDSKMKIYQRKEGVTGAPFVFSKWSDNHVTAIMAGIHKDAGKISLSDQRPMRSLIENALLKVMPAALLVNGNGDIFHIYGRTGIYLEPMQGDSATNNILKMAREGLMHELTVALHRAVTTKEISRCPGIRVKTNGDFTTVNLIIRPLIIDKAQASSSMILGSMLYLVTLEEVPPDTKSSNKTSVDSCSDAHLEALRMALQANEEYLQVTREELQTSNEEFQSSNEEMQSMNEELQSTNEELETSREELQSVNEELSTVNSEMQAKMAELSKANNDMNNMLSGTGIATVFVDCQLRILNFTPSINMIINLIPTDVGRSIAHFVSNLIGYDHMIADIQAVLDTLIPKDVKVQTTAGRWYKMRIQPYLTINKVIEGAVITMIDITNDEDVRKALRKANEQLRLAVVVRDSYDAITVHDMNGRIIAWNPGAVRMFGWSEAEALEMNILDRIPKDLKKEELLKLHQLSHAESLKPYVTLRLTRDGSIVEVSMISTPLVNEDGHIYAIATTERMKTLTKDMDNEK